jgi:DNA-binding beta-propeller fold protein YncE
MQSPCRSLDVRSDSANVCDRTVAESKVQRRWLSVRKYLLIGILVGVSSPQVRSETPPDIPYKSVPNFLKLPPHLYLGEACGVAVNSKGHIFVFSRSGHTQLLEFDPQGNFIRSIGDDLYGFSAAHDLRIDSEDNIWAVDEGTNMVIKFNPEGQVVMVLGRKPVAGATVERRADGSSPSVPADLVSLNSPKWFYGPTDVAWGPAGEIYVSDGHGNSQVVKLDKNGNWVKAWGKRGAGPGEFNEPHGIATDSRGRVYVADRANNRVQIFDPEGNFLKQWTNVGAPVSICITPPPHQVVYTSAGVPGRIYKLDLDGNILGMLGRPGKQIGEFTIAFEVSCPTENELLITEPTNWRVQKLILDPTP